MTQRNRQNVDGILSSDADRLGKEAAQQQTFAAARTVTQAVRSTLGPRGKDKMLEQSDGTVLITNDATTILNRIKTESPAASLLTELGTQSDGDLRDGTTTAVILAGALSREAERLLEQGSHPATIIGGYDRASSMALEELQTVALTEAPEHQSLRRVAETTMTGKGVGTDRSMLADLVVSAADAVEEDGAVDTNRIRVVTQSGRPTDDSRLWNGAVLQKDPVRQAMPASIEDARVLLTDVPLQLNDTSLDMSVEIQEQDSFTRFLEQEDEQVQAIVEHLLDTGANAVLCSSSIADEVQSVLSVRDVLGVRRFDDETLSFVAAVLGGTVVSSIMDATTADLGTGRITRDSTDELFLIEGSSEPRATILLRAPTPEICDELETHVETALEVVANASNEPLVAGGGAVEVELSQRLRERATAVEGREQLAVEAFASALETVPRTLAENAGIDPLDALTTLRTAHASGERWAGIARNGETTDMLNQEVVEPAAVKRQALVHATGAIRTLLRVDDVLSVGELSDIE